MAIDGEPGEIRKLQTWNYNPGSQTNPTIFDRLSLGKPPFLVVRDYHPKGTTRGKRRILRVKRLEFVGLRCEIKLDCFSKGLGKHDKYI